MEDEAMAKLATLLVQYAEDYIEDGVDPNKDTINDVLLDASQSLPAKLMPQGWQRIVHGRES